MTNPTDHFKINLNQNLWGLIICLLTLGIGEFFKLCTLYVFGLIISIFACISFAITLTAYTINYWASKKKKHGDK
jgi:hypothetical protein